MTREKHRKWNRLRPVKHTQRMNVVLTKKIFCTHCSHIARGCHGASYRRTSSCFILCLQGLFL